MVPTDHMVLEYLYYPAMVQSTSPRTRIAYRYSTFWRSGTRRHWHVGDVVLAWYVMQVLLYVVSAGKCTGVFNDW